LLLTVSRQRNFVAEFIQAKCNFTCKTLRFCAPFGGLGTTYYDHLRLNGKQVVDFLSMLTELFSLDVTAEALRANIGSKLAISLQQGPADPKYHVEGVAPPHQPFFFSEN